MIHQKKPKRAKDFGSKVKSSFFRVDLVSTAGTGNTMSWIRNKTGMTHRYYDSSSLIFTYSDPPVVLLWEDESLPER